MEDITLDIKIDVTDIIVAGTGATGSNFIPFLTQLANNLDKSINITFVDGDKFESKNKRNQKCLDIDIGKSKVEVLASRYSKVYPNLDIRYKDEYLYTKSDVKSLLIGNSRYYYRTCYIPILIGTVDNNSTRQLLHEVFYDNYLKDVIYIDSGNGTEDMMGQVIIGLKKDGKVILPPVGDVFPSILEDNDKIENEVGCAATQDEHPQNIATNILAATTLFTIINKLLSFNEIDKHKIFFDARDVRMSPKSINRQIIN